MPVLKEEGKFAPTGDDMPGAKAAEGPAGSGPGDTNSSDMYPHDKSRFLEELYRAHWSNLVGWLRQRYGAGPPAPEDIAQTAFERIAALDSVNHIRHPKSFLYRAAANAALDTIEWIQRTRRFIDDELYRRGEDLEQISPEHVSLAREEFEHMAAALEGLSPKQRDIVIRNRFWGQTYDQIAAETGWSKTDVFRQLKSALITVRQALDAYNADDAR